jgi:DNA-binding MarR family transcriptional regulator
MAKNPEAPPAWRRLGDAERIGFLLKSLQHTLRQNLDEALRKQGLDLSFAQLACLFSLHYEPGISGAQIARRAMVSAQTMNAALHTLELDGYLERRPHPDSRRADSWSLTKAGLAELERARAVGTSIFGRMLATLGDDEIAAFANYLRRCLAALDPASEIVASEIVAARPRVTAAQRRQKAGASSTRNV